MSASGADRPRRRDDTGCAATLGGAATTAGRAPGRSGAAGHFDRGSKLRRRRALPLARACAFATRLARRVPGAARGSGFRGRPWKTSTRPCQEHGRVAFPRRSVERRGRVPYLGCGVDRQRPFRALEAPPGEEQDQGFQSPDGGQSGQDPCYEKRHGRHAPGGSCRALRAFSFGAFGSGGDRGVSTSATFAIARRSVPVVERQRPRQPVLKTFEKSGSSRIRPPKRHRGSIRASPRRGSKRATGWALA
jgi:hypothetical protein